MNKRSHGWPDSMRNSSSPVAMTFWAENYRETPPGSAILLNGVEYIANREIGVPGKSRRDART